MKRLSIAVLTALLTVSAFPAAALAGGGYRGHRGYSRPAYRPSPRHVYRRFAPVRRRHYVPRIIVPYYRPHPGYLFKIIVPFVWRW